MNHDFIMDLDVSKDVGRKQGCLLVTVAKISLVATLNFDTLCVTSYWTWDASSSTHGTRTSNSTNMSSMLLQALPATNSLPIVSVIDNYSVLVVRYCTQVLHVLVV